ncbi:MAG: hypothetical protein ACFCU5_06900 [Pleurocapsa sp.]
MTTSQNYGRGMEKVVIIINAEVDEQGKFLSAAPVTERMVEALKRSVNACSSSPISIQVTSAAALCAKSSRDEDNSRIICPLTIQLPDYLDFPAKKIFSACKDIVGRRRWVDRNLGFKTSCGDSWLGHLWLPVVLTDQEIIYAEVIGEGAMPNSYEQPVMIPKRQRRSLHELAEGLLESLSAPPSVYLIQFSLHNGEIVFDRLWPFPAAPALITTRTQQPDLFTCHWSCLTGRPISSLTVLDAKMPI